MKTYKIIYKFLVLIIGISVIFTACTSTFDDINTDPDSPSIVSSKMLAVGLLFDYVAEGYDEDSDFLAKRLFWGEQIEPIQYNAIGNASFSGVVSLTNAQKMMELAPADRLDAYTGLYYYLKGWEFYFATMQVGDIPYSQALQIDEFPMPKYDSQKDVFIGILSDLAQADKYFAKATLGVEGDSFYGGDPVKWRKATNVLRLKVLMSLQKRAEDTPDLKIKETFASIVAEGNIFKGNEDNLQVVYANKTNQQNPYHNTNTKSIDVYGGTETIIDPLKEYNDYRLFHYFAPAQALTDPLYLPDGETLLEKNDWNAYFGLDAVGLFGTESDKIALRMHSRPADIYRLTYEGVPYIRLGYSDMNFVLAEAAERDWISGSAKDYYEKGVRASLEFVASTDAGNKYNQGMEMTEAYIVGYLAGPKVAYAATFEARMEQIHTQSYLGSHLQLAWNSYFEYRRTGYPEWPINPDTNQNDERTKIPVRWLYPSRETSYNKESLFEAVDRQWNGVESVNGKMWLIK